MFFDCGFQRGEERVCVKMTKPRCSDSQHPSIHCWLYQWHTVMRTDHTFSQAGNKQWAWTPRWMYERERKKKKEWFITPFSQPNPHSLFDKLSTQPTIINLSRSAFLSSVATEQLCCRSLMTSHYRGTLMVLQKATLTFNIDFPKMAEISLTKCLP